MAFHISHFAKLCRDQADQSLFNLQRAKFETIFGSHIFLSQQTDSCEKCTLHSAHSKGTQLKCSNVKCMTELAHGFHKKKKYSFKHNGSVTFVVVAKVKKLKLPFFCDQIVHKIWKYHRRGNSLCTKIYRKKSRLCAFKVPIQLRTVYSSECKEPWIYCKCKTTVM